MKAETCVSQELILPLLVPYHMLLFVERQGYRLRASLVDTHKKQEQGRSQLLTDGTSAICVDFVASRATEAPCVHY